jgi:hypothetical protein
MPQSLAARFAIAFLLFVCGLAMWRGRTPERLIGIAAVLEEAFYLAFYHPNDNVHAQWESMWIDLVYAIAISAVAIRFNRAWTKWAAAFALLLVGTHLAVGLDLRIATYFGYWSATVWTTAIWWALLAGTIQVILEDWRARKAAGAAAPPA